MKMKKANVVRKCIREIAQVFNNHDMSFVLKNTTTPSKESSPLFVIPDLMRSKYEQNEICGFIL
jgi:hypothetical protein